MKEDIIKILGYSYVVQQLPDDEEGGYNLFIPVLGKLSCRAYGDTFEEAYSNLCDVLAYFVQEYKDKGIELPKEQDDESIEEEIFSGRTVLRMPKDMHKQLAVSAKRNGISLNTYLVSLLEKESTMEEMMSILTKNNDKCENCKFANYQSNYEKPELKIVDGDYSKVG